jgi:hypothetical protein
MQRICAPILKLDQCFLVCVGCGDGFGNCRAPAWYTQAPGMGFSHTCSLFTGFIRLHVLICSGFSSTGREHECVTATPCQYECMTTALIFVSCRTRWHGHFGWMNTHIERERGPAWHAHSHTHTRVCLVVLFHHSPWCVCMYVRMWARGTSMQG